ncbi:MAG TPA: sialate O-acetylesterase [Candidatus Hydrogenedentes bacterium]|nr:sialate O-acetylesterase [Candidatus Hydrogenedentota bacterium]
MRVLRPFWFITVLLLLGVIPPATAEVSLPPLFKDHMVLQRGTKLPIWGRAAPGESVEVAVANRAAHTAADADGRWRAVLRPLNAGGPHRLVVKGETNSIAFEDVLVGEVWVCSGQSNMEWPVSLARDAENEIAAADFPEIRFFSVPKKVADVPQQECGGKWTSCRPKSAAQFSAVGYFFGRSLHRKLGVPIGLIHASWGGTPAEAWTSQAALDADPAFIPLLERWARILADYPDAKAEYDRAFIEWEQAAKKAKDEGKPEPPRPWPPLGPGHPWRPAALYNAMVAPLAPFAIQGAIWYQGESNADRAYEYRTLFPAMIQDWRRAWSQGDFPFLFVQLANFMGRFETPQPKSAWAELREAQLMTLALDNTGMAVTIDIGEANDIHPKNKQDVGERLALAALAKAYGKKVAYSGPLYKRMKIKGNEVVVSFTHTNRGLATKGGAPLKGFAIAGPDQEFVWADARIRGKKVVVYSDSVPSPVAVRYAWADNPECNLYNGAGLPASPFRTDDWRHDGE